MTAELGLNLAGVERVLELENRLARAQRRANALERELVEARREAEAAKREAATMRRALEGELVPYRATGSALIPVRRATPRDGR